jgi:ABC-2 type transport system ATP-binding protein
MSHAGRVDGAPAYDIRGLTKRHRGAGRPANDGIDLTVTRGEIVGLLGPNGAGKTTLVRQLVGVLAPDSGTVHCFGYDVGARPATASRFAAYLAQDEPALAELSVAGAIDVTARLRGCDRRAARVAATALVDELELGAVAGRPLVRLSGGQRRLASLAAALAGDRPVLVLDEPTTGLDPQARAAVWAALTRRRDRGDTVVLVTHNVVEAERLLDRVAVLSGGRLVACDTPGRLKAMVSDDVTLSVVWRAAPPLDDGGVAELAAVAVVDGLRWSARMPVTDAQRLLGRLTRPPVVDHLDDFRLTTPSLDDVYTALGLAAGDLERV